MPIRDIKIPELMTHVVQPVIEQTVRAVLIDLGLRHYFDDNIMIIAADQALSDTSDGTHNARLSVDRCNVTYSVNFSGTENKFDTSAFRFTQAHGYFGKDKYEYRPIFFDREADILLTENQVPCTVTMEFNLQFKNNKERAYLTSTAITNKQSQNTVVVPHDLYYDYPLSVLLLKYLYTLYKNKFPDKQMSFEHYLQAGTKKNISFLKSKTTKDSELVIKKTQINALGFLEYSQSEPEVEKEEQYADRYNVNFNYTLQFARPDMLRFYYPIIVNNKLVPEYMVRAGDQTFVPTITGLQNEMVIANYARDLFAKRETLPPAKIPYYDDFIIPNNSHLNLTDFTPLMQEAFLLDEGPVTIVDMKDVGTYQYNPVILDIIKAHGNDIFDIRGLFNITVFANNVAVDPSCLSIDQDLLISVRMTSKHKVYHYVLSENTNINKIDPKWVKTILEYRTYFPMTIMKNLRYFIDIGYYYIDRSNIVLNVTSTLINTRRIDDILDILVNDGHVDSSIYMFTQTPEQLIDHMTQIYSKSNHAPLYEAYVNICISKGYFKEERLASGYIKTADGYPTLSNTRVHNFNLPLRIIDVDVTPHKG